MSDAIHFHIKTVCPVHVGCDDTYEPMGFVVDEEKQLIRVFDPLDFIRALNPVDKAIFGAICAEGTVESLLRIYNFMRGRMFPGREVALSSGFVTHYRDTLKLSGKDGKKIQQELNRFSIARTAYNRQTGLPYLPGSAVKGALRTAWLNELQSRRHIPKDYKRTGRELEILLLDGGEFETDPFRLLKVSDFMPAGSVRSRAVYAVNEKKSPSKFRARGAYQILEVIEPGSVFEGTIRVEKTSGDGVIRSPLDVKSLFTGARCFYSSVLKKENEELAGINIKGILPFWSEGDLPLRVGRHSGAESVTIDGHRRIRIIQGKGKTPKELEHATTLWLASDERRSTTGNLRQFGWVTAIPGPAPVEMSPHDTDKALERPQKALLQATADHSAQVNDVPPKTAGQKLIDQLALIKPSDKGRLGTIIQKIDSLQDVGEKAAVALAIKKKLAPKDFKALKRKNDLEEFIRQGPAL